jgi:hypothetical protein
VISINRLAILQYKRGLAEANAFIEAEHLARLKSILPGEALRTYLDLYHTWEQTGKVAGGNLKFIAECRLDDHLNLREAFASLARSRNQPNE